MPSNNDMPKVRLSIFGIIFGTILFGGIPFFFPDLDMFTKIVISVILITLGTLICMLIHIYELKKFSKLVLDEKNKLLVKRNYLSSVIRSRDSTVRQYETMILRIEQGLNTLAVSPKFNREYILQIRTQIINDINNVKENINNEK